MHRVARLFLALLAFSAFAADFDPVVPGRVPRFPEDAGAHPGHRIEWWYVTGHLDSREGPLGFQVTFFRVRHREAGDNPSRFSPRQILFAHAALADPRRGRLLHGERVARALPPLVDARAGDTDVRIEDWWLKREAASYRSVVATEEFALDLSFTPTQPVMLQGDKGFSRKGPRPEAASHYYSEPHLGVRGRVRVAGRDLEVTGIAWLDHEWSSEYLASDAVGWDWVGLNLDGGGAIMAFRMRARDGSAVWSGGTLRLRGGEARSLAPESVRFIPRRNWRSPRTGTDYPVGMEVQLEGGTWKIDPIMDDQELDARSTSGVLYWEGAVRVTGPRGETGRGYMELTGYGVRVPF